MHVLDKYAIAALGAFHDSADAVLMLAEWESMSEADRVTWRSVVDAVLMAAEVMPIDRNAARPAQAPGKLGMTSQQVYPPVDSEPKLKKLPICQDDWHQSSNDADPMKCPTCGHRRP